MPKYTLLPIIFFLFQLTQLSAQDRWDSKLVVRHSSGITDTIWFGMDVNATEGFDADLDSLDTNLDHPISILAQNELVRQQFNTPYCGNLKRDYKPFKTGKVEFEFWIKSDSFPDFFNSNPVEIFWDTTDFSFNSENFEIKVVRIQTIGGYLTAIDNNEHYLYYNTWTFVEDTNVRLIYESTPWICSSNDKLMGFLLEVWVNTYLNIQPLRKENILLIFPNPNNGQFKLQFGSQISGQLKILDFSGKIIQEKSIVNSTEEELNIPGPLGLYFLQFFSEENDTFITQKIIKQ